MTYLKRISFSFLLITIFSSTAFAGDGATIVLRSGVKLYFANGYKQLVNGVKEFNKKSSENYIAELNIAGDTFMINLDEVAVLCRDRCSSIEITNPKKE